MPTALPWKRARARCTTGRMAEHGGAGSGDRGGEVHRPHRHAGIYGQRTGGRFPAPPAAMIPVLPPAALGQEIAACTVLGASIGRTAGCIPGQRACSFCAGSGVDGCCAGCCAELRSRAEQCRCSALVHGCGSLCRCRCSSLCAGCTAACSGRRFTAPGAPAGRAAARPAEKGAQTTPQRKKNCKKAQKELAKPAPHDV